MGYARFSLKKFSPAFGPYGRGAGRKGSSPLGLRKGGIVHGRSLLYFLTFRNQLSPLTADPRRGFALYGMTITLGTRSARRPDGVGHHGAALANRLFGSDG